MMKLKKIPIYAACFLSLTTAFAVPVLANEAVAVPSYYEAVADFTDFKEGAEFLTIWEIEFENSTVIPVYVVDSYEDPNKRWVEIRNNAGETLLIIDKKMTCMVDDRLMVLKDYYESDIKPLIEANKK